MKLTADELKTLRDYINEKSGIFIREDKYYFLENRLVLRLNETGTESFKDYFRMLKYSGTNEELERIIEALTINETYFFRSPKQLNMFSQEALPELEKSRRREGSKTINIWCAGCSTGEEAYTIAMLCKEAALSMSVKITATDINRKVIDFAKYGVYSGRSLKDVPPAILGKYFKRTGDNYEVVPDIMAMVNFSVLNLVDNDRMRLMVDMDFIWCRNVLIYFEKAITRQVINSFYDSLKKNGYIILGMAESMHLYSGAFKVVKFKELFGYRKD